MALLQVDSPINVFLLVCEEGIDEEKSCCILDKSKDHVGICIDPQQ